MNKKLMRTSKADMTKKVDGTPLKNKHNSYKGWEGSEYDPAYCGELVTMMSEGMGKEAFTAKHGIGRRTFYQWVRDYPEFNAAYASGKEKARRHMTQLLHANILEYPDSPKLNMRAYAALMKHSLCVDDSRELEGLEVNGTALSKIEQVTKLVLAGEISVDEGNKVVGLIKIGVEVGEMAEVKERIEELERVLKGE